MASTPGQIRPARYLATFAGIVVVLYALVFLTGDGRPAPKLGIDLQGGTRVTLVARTESGAVPRKQRPRRLGEPLWQVAGGFRQKVPLYDTEGGWLHLSTDELMVDANQSMTHAEARLRAAAFEPLGLSWFEEPLPADDVAGHVALARSTSIPIAVGESLYSVAQFRDYLARGAASIVQADVARVGGITPWLKIAHLAEAFTSTSARTSSWNCT